MANPTGSTPQYGLPYLKETDAPDVATASQQLAQAIENLVKTMRIGSVVICGGSAPTGALLCQGQAISRTTYTELFAKWGTVFGAGDGVTTFNLPDLRGRAPIGSGHGTGLTTRTLGEKGGNVEVASGTTSGRTTTPWQVVNFAVFYN